MKPRILRLKKNQTWLLPAARAELWAPLEEAHRMLERFRLMLREPNPRRRGVLLSPVRCILLATIGRESGLGVTPARLARVLELPRGTVAHHLNVLEREGLVLRRPQNIHDGRRVAVVLTAKGATAVARTAAALTALGVGARPPNAVARDRWNQRLVTPAARS